MKISMCVGLKKKETFWNWRNPSFFTHYFRKITFDIMKSLEICENFHRFFHNFFSFWPKKKYILPFKMRFSRLNPLWLLMYLKYTCVAQRCAHNVCTCTCMQLHTCRTCGPFVFGQISRNLDFIFEQAEGQARRVKMSALRKNMRTHVHVRRVRHENAPEA